MSEQGPSSPTPQTLKRLFALSGNRCAFPKCQQRLVDGDIVLGEICHIAAASPGGPRYNSQLSAEDRRSFDNLVLLCSIHHTVVDSDTVAYTEERLRRMKEDHQKSAAKLDQTEIEAGSATFLSQGMLSNNQSGGIAAHTLNAGTINLGPGPHRFADIERSRAVNELWDTLLKLKKEFRDINYIDCIFTVDELNRYFTKGELSNHFDGIRYYANPGSIVEKWNRAGVDRAERLRPLVSAALWQIFFAYRSILGRLAFLFEKSFREKQYCDWRTDSGFDQILRSVVGEPKLSEYKRRGPHALGSFLEHLESSFSYESARYLSLTAP